MTPAACSARCARALFIGVVIGLAILFPRVPDLAQRPRRASAASAPERTLTGAFQDGVVAHTLVTPTEFRRSSVAIPFAEAAREQRYYSDTPPTLEGGRGRFDAINAMQLTSNATLAEFSIDILLWKIPLNSHFADAAEAEPQAFNFSSTEVSRRQSCRRRSPAPLRSCS